MRGQRGKVAREAIPAVMAQDAREWEIERNHYIIEAADEGISLVDPDDRIAYVNPAIARMLGYAPEELVGRSAYDVVFPEDREDQAFHFAQRRAGVHEMREARYRRKDGSELWVQLTSNPFIDRQGAYRGCVALSTDITERKQREAREKAREARLKREQTALLALVRSPPLWQGDMAATIHEVTALVARTLDVERVGLWWCRHDPARAECQELFERRGERRRSGMVLPEAEHPAYFDALRSTRVLVLQDARKDPRTRSFYDEYLVPYGIASRMDVPIYSAGAMVGVLCLEHRGRPRIWTEDEQTFASAVGDLLALGLEASERQRTEHARVLLAQQASRHETLIRSTQLELEAARELAHLKDHFLSAISHEIKTPLSVIMGNAELLADHCSDAGLIEGVLEGCQRLTRQVNKIIDYSALLSGSLPLHLSEIDWPEFLAALQGAMADDPALLRRCPHVETELVPGTPHLQADFRRLMQAAIELLENACKFTPAGSPFGIRIAPAPDGVRLEVWDSGPGLAEADRERVWEAFAQYGCSPEDCPSGLGLGLSIVKQLAELHGGRAEVACPPTGGCRFTLHLPLNASHAGAAP